MRGECLMLLRLVLEGDEDLRLGMLGPKARAARGGHGARGSSPLQKPSTGRDSAYRQRNSRSKSSTMRPRSCSTMLVWAWLQSQVKLGAECQGQEAKCRTLGLGRRHSKRQPHHHHSKGGGRALTTEFVRVLARLGNWACGFPSQGLSLPVYRMDQGQGSLKSLQFRGKIVIFYANSIKVILPHRNHF